MHHHPARAQVTAFLGTLIGAVTLTGSAVAFGKLHGVLPSAPLALPAKNAINVGLLAGGWRAGGLGLGGWGLAADLLAWGASCCWVLSKAGRRGGQLRGLGLRSLAAVIGGGANQRHR
jgi:hypothetical protein